MRSNPRLFIRLFQDAIIKNNPIIVAFEQIRKIISVYSEFFGKSQKISKNICDNKLKLEKAKSIIELNSKKENFNSINLIR